MKLHRFVWIAAILLMCGPTLLHAQGKAFQWDLGANEGLYTHTADDTSDFTAVFRNDPVEAVAVDFDSTDTLYYIDLLGISYGTVDSLTAQLVPLGILTGDVPAGSAAMSIDPSTDTMWVTDGDSLWSIDLNAGVVTAGPSITGNSGQILGIAINSIGDMYGYDVGDNTLYAIDKTTGVATAIGTSAQNGNLQENGMDFDTSDVLYHALYTGAGAGSYGTWDLNTGVFTEIAPHTSFPTLTPGLGGESASTRRALSICGIPGVRRSARGQKTTR